MFGVLGCSSFSTSPLRCRFFPLLSIIFSHLTTTDVAYGVFERFVRSFCSPQRLYGISASPIIITIIIIIIASKGKSHIRTAMCVFVRFRFGSFGPEHQHQSYALLCSGLIGVEKLATFGGFLTECRFVRLTLTLVRSLFLRVSLCSQTLHASQYFLQQVNMTKVQRIVFVIRSN